MSEDINTQNEKKRYRSSLGATLLFSGVQFYQILIRIIKSKFVALFIGPVGMGISSLLHTTAELISASTNLGLKTSGVKTVSAAYAENNMETISKTIAVLRRLILLTGLVGMVVCAALAPLWSKVSFGNKEYVWSFVFVSLLILFEQLNNGELVLLQGMRQKKTLARANVIGQTLSLLLTVPLYYFYGLKAIVWVLVLSPIISFSISRYFTYKLHINVSKISWTETFSIGWEMIKLGFFLSLQFLMSHIMVYIVRNYVSNRGGVEDVGLYSAGTAIVTTYVGLVFTAIATDYFPRLAATKSNEEMATAIHTQAELTISLLAPLIITFIVFCKPIIILLYSDKFLPIEHMMYWALGAVLLQAMAWAISYSLLAKAKPLHFFLNELGAKCYSVPLRLLGYHFLGLTGFGVATFLSYGLYMTQCMIVSKRLFGFKYNSSIWKLLVLLFIPVFVAGLSKYFLVSWFSYVIGLIVLAITGIAVIYWLEKRMGIVNTIKSKIHKRKLEKWQ